MNKMMLIINEPKDCYHCPIHKTQCLSLTGMNPDYNLIGKRPDWCPLKTIPQKKQEEYDMLNKNDEDEYIVCGKYKDSVAIGYNQCIDEILKGGSNGI